MFSTSLTGTQVGWMVGAVLLGGATLLGGCASPSDVDAARADAGAAVCATASGEGVIAKMLMLVTDDLWRRRRLTRVE